LVQGLLNDIVTIVFLNNCLLTAAIVMVSELTIINPYAKCSNNIYLVVKFVLAGNWVHI